MRSVGAIGFGAEAVERREISGECDLENRATIVRSAQERGPI